MFLKIGREAFQKTLKLQILKCISKKSTTCVEVFEPKSIKKSQISSFDSQSDFSGTVIQKFLSMEGRGLGLCQTKCDRKFVIGEVEDPQTKFVFKPNFEFLSW